MASLNNALQAGIHEQAMQLRVKRAEVLGNNLANADTPNYKARDIDFKTLLKNQDSMMKRPNMRATHSRHIAPSRMINNIDLQYRVPLQPSLDGNTVDEQSELSRFTKNSLDFQATFKFLNSKFKGMKKALKGGE